MAAFSDQIADDLVPYMYDNELLDVLTGALHSLFFGDDTGKYELCHCEDALIIIHCGCMVDEFQHRMYENPELTPAQRNEVWTSLEKKYRPWIDFDNLPFFRQRSRLAEASCIFTSIRSITSTTAWRRP